MEEILLTRLAAFAKEIEKLCQSDLCINVTSDNVESVKIHISKLKSILTRFNTELYNYFNISKDPNADEISNLTTIQLNGEEILAELEAKIKLQPDLTSTASCSSSKGNNLTSKLPELHLPTFKGDVLEWHQFWDQFSSNIDQRNLNDVDKLLYLKTSLKGDAKRTIEGLATTNKNYRIAVTHLKERYGKEAQLIDAHYSKLYKIKGAERIEDCRRTINEIERHLRVLHSLGEDINHNHLRFLITEKFPEDVIYELKMKTSTESIDEMRKQLELIISAREDANRLAQEKDFVEAKNYTRETLHVKEEKMYNVNKHRGKTSYNSNNAKRHINNGPSSRYGSNNLTNNKGNLPIKSKYEERREINSNKLKNKRRKFMCIFCQGAHYNDECSNIKTMEERKAKLKGRCFNCLQKGHLSNTCKHKTCAHCRQYGAHNRALCPKRLQTKAQPTNLMHINERGPTVLQTAVVTDRGQDEITMKCRLLLDSGSQRSYINKKVARDLNLKVEEENQLFVFTLGSTTPQKLESPLVKLEIETRTNKVKTIYANIVPLITHGIPYPEHEIKTWNLDQKYKLADDGTLSDRVDILIGNDYYYSIMSTQKVQLKEHLYLVESELGWILSGTTARKPVDKLAVNTYFQSSSVIGLNPPDSPLDNGNLKFLWDLESIGITDSPKINRDGEAIKHFNENTKFEDNRYQVCWPWNQYPPNLPSNFGLAYGRLINLLKRLDSKSLLTYDQTITEQLKRGIIEPVPNNERVDHPVHYIPHHGVTAPGKSIRIVYDASAKTKDNKSLNECLYCGPMMLEDLTGLIIKFRCHAIGITADVEKAFLQIGLQERDRDVTRFLWIRNLARPATEENLIHLRFTRVPFGVISSPFLLNATIRHHLSLSKRECIRKLANDIYVDNVLTGASDTQHAVQLYEASKEAFNQISMNLRAWSSNSKEFMKHVSDKCQDKVVKVLGLNWHVEEDTLQLKFNNNSNYLNTKRGILKRVASIYDPCGYTVPYLLPAKLLLQDLWKLKIKWDKPLPKDIISKWKEIQEDLNQIHDICLPRCFMKNPHIKNCEIHCFTDASTRAYAAVVYIVVGANKSFVIGKSRLVPIKDQADLKIPRLELLGVLIGSRLIQYVIKFLQFKVTQQILWTDSQIVIDWYNSQKLLTPFVSRRIEEIKRNKNLSIRHIPSGLNPADVATRPDSTAEEKRRWLSGPEFILKNRSEWPTVPLRDNSLLVAEDLPNKEVEMIPEGKDIQTDDSKVIESDKEIEKQDKGSEIQVSLLQEIKNLQSKYFPDEVNGKQTNLRRNLRLFKDIDGLLRCKGRLKYAEGSFDKRYPMLIPKKCEFTEKLIKDVHEKNYHVGVNHTLSIIRESYWIPQGKSQVQSILRKCPRCVKHGGGPFKLPPTPALPPERVNFSMPFTFTGIDYLGPVLVKTESGTSKRWICLFTCLAVRAIHLEVVQDLSAEEGLLALRRMISTRGVPTLITSDNAVHFKLIAEILSKPYCVENKIRWRFIPALAPWFGGFYERLVGMVKHCMRRTLQKHLLRDSLLLTIIKEIEAILNTRPLTCVDSELDHILKPSDFLNLGKVITMETAHEDPLIQGTITKTDLVKGWRRARVILEEFKEMFCNRYLPSLRERYSHSHKEPRVKSSEIPKEGQIVQIKGDKNREGWKVGKIISLVKSADGLCRVAKVKVDNTIFTRSISHLYPLEVEEFDQRNNKYYVNVNPIRSEVFDDDETTNTTDTPTVVMKDKVDSDIIKSSEEETVNDSDMTIDSTDKTTEITDQTDNAIDMTEPTSIRNDNSNEEDVETRIESAQEIKPKRSAAVRALEKIKEWTRDLITTLL